jgi:hypothetical protein
LPPEAREDAAESSGSNGRIWATVKEQSSLSTAPPPKPLVNWVNRRRASPFASK